LKENHPKLHNCEFTGKPHHLRAGGVRAVGTACPT
jgi:hypothetical protein